jgi:hypothetical protein
MTKEEQEREALFRAKYGRSMGNYMTIIQGFIDKGIPEQEIRPRENVFTYQAWKAQGKQVKRGEHGVKCCTWISTEKKIEHTDGTETVKRGKIPRTVTVFHVSQVE